MQGLTRWLDGFESSQDTQGKLAHNIRANGESHGESISAKEVANCLS